MRPRALRPLKPLFFLFQVPKPPRQSPAAERTVIEPYIARPFLAEYEKVIGINFCENPAVCKQVQRRDLRHSPIDQIPKIIAAAHCFIVGPERSSNESGLERV